MTKILHLFYDFLVYRDFIVAYVQSEAANFIETSKPRMFFYSFKAESLLRLDIYKTTEEIFKFWGHFTVYQINSAFDFTIKDRGIIIFKWQFCHYHSEQNYS